MSNSRPARSTATVPPRISARLHQASSAAASPHTGGGGSAQGQPWQLQTGTSPKQTTAC